MHKLLKYPLLLAAALTLSCGMTACGDDGPEPEPKPNPQPNPNPNPDPKPTGPVTYNLPRKELRAAFIATVSNIDWPANKTSAEMQKREYTEYLDLFKKLNLNAVLMQIRPTSDAFFKSDLEPWSEWITGTQGKDPGYDVLQFMIDECHKRGMEFHAWVNPYRISNSASSFASKGVASHPAKVHPEWTFQYGQKLIYRPALPEVQQFITDVIDEICTKYPVDGIHFDDYFYPYPESGASYDDAADYAKYGSAYSNIGDFRRANVDKAIEKVHNMLAQKHPGVAFTISPFGIYRNTVNGGCGNGLQNYDDLYADITKWCNNGWVDMVAPQLYGSTKRSAINFTQLCGWWAQNCGQALPAVSMPIYKFGVDAEIKADAQFGSTAELDLEFRTIRNQPKMAGHFLYNANSIRANRLSLQNVIRTAYADQALIPPMGTMKADKPADIADLKADGLTLTWTAQAPGTRYVIYRVTGTTDPKVCNARVAAIVTTPSYTGSVGNYAVSALNADNVESALTQPLELKKK